MTESILKNEEEFHDQWAESVDLKKIPVRELFESEACPENKQILSWMGDIAGKKLLDLGCGLGESSVYFALMGAEVTASDLSTGMLNVTKKLANMHNTSLSTIKTSATDLSVIADNSFDIVYAANLLHHVDIKLCINEIMRILKPGGTAYFWDPLVFNPLIEVYRKMATEVRTEDEHPLTSEDLKFIQSKFSHVDFKFFWISGLSVFLKYFLIDRLHPNKVRYWKKIIEDSRELSDWLRFFHSLDQKLLKFSFFKYLCWNVAIQAKK